MLEKKLRNEVKKTKRAKNGLEKMKEKLNMEQAEKDKEIKKLKKDNKILTSELYQTQSTLESAIQKTTHLHANKENLLEKTHLSRPW